MRNLLELNQPDLVALLAEWGQPKFRAAQIMAWIYERHVTEFAAMTNLPQTLRARLAAEL